MSDKESYHHGDLKNALVAAGVEILAGEGLNAISLRNVAKKAGVSHSAPYAHFKDKQALLAAISTEGFKKLLTQLKSVVSQYKEQPEQLLPEACWVYYQFALQETNIFKMMFSGVLEKEKDYSDFVEVVQKTFQVVVEVVTICQTAGILQAGESQLTAMTLWAQIHGMISLYLEGQISHTILDQHDLREILLYSLNQLALVPIS